MKAFKIVLILLFVSFVSFAQDENFVKENYNKTETTITMRDGVKLFTVIYSPKDTSKNIQCSFKERRIVASLMAKMSFVQRYHRMNF